jgi:hypothetical protein
VSNVGERRDVPASRLGIYPEAIDLVLQIVAARLVPYPLAASPAQKRADVQGDLVVTSNPRRTRAGEIGEPLVSALALEDIERY